MNRPVARDGKGDCIMGASVPDGNGAVQEAGAGPVPEVIAEGGHLALPDGGAPHFCARK
ncbi:hypothetical protein KAM371_19890 [Aeromonas caviae]|nr:hypothetical protein KAM371_19890 [Aeromonas caviae]